MSDEKCCGACGYPVHATKEMACDWCRKSADRIETLIAKLAKAVDLAIEECPFRHGTPRYNDWWHHRRATLAEIRGESHEALPDLR